MAMPILAALNLPVDESAILKAPHPGLQPVTNTNLRTDEHLAEHDQPGDGGILTSRSLVGTGVFKNRWTLDIWLI